LNSLAHGWHCQTSIVTFPNPASQVLKFPTGKKDIAIDIITFDTRVIPSSDPSNIRLSGCYIQLKKENDSGRSIREVILTLPYHQNT
jgi:hypothetical protein